MTWDVATGHLQHVLDERSGYEDALSLATSCTFSPDGKSALVGHHRGKVVLFGVGSQ
jgi:hypothetical protein